MEIEPLAPQEENNETEYVDGKSALETLTATIESATNQGEAVSPLLEDIVDFMRGNPDEPFELSTKNPGRLIQEGEKIPMYILLSAVEQPIVYKNVDINGIQQEMKLATLRMPTVIGEISKLLNGEATVSVELTSPTSLFKLSEDQFTRMSQSESFQQRHIDIANERLQRQIDIMEHVDTVLGHRGEEYNQPSLSETLQVSSTFAEALQTGRAVRNFSLSGIHRETGEQKLQEFVATFEKKSEGGVTVDITGSEENSRIIIPLKLTDNGRHVAIERQTVDMDNAAGYGFYSKILNTFLEKADVFKSDVTEPGASSVIDPYPSGEIVPTSDVAAASPIFAARHGFISYIRKGESVTSYRVDKQLSRILRLATDIERDRIAPANNHITRQYGLSKQDVSRVLLQLTTQYMGSEGPQQLPKEAQDALDAQVTRIRELCSEE